MERPQPLFRLFWSLPPNITTICTANICKKCPSSVWSCDLNPQPLEHESPPIATRPGVNFMSVSLEEYFLQENFLQTWVKKFHSEEKSWRKEEFCLVEKCYFMRQYKFGIILDCRKILATEC